MHHLMMRCLVRPLTYLFIISSPCSLLVTIVSSCRELFAVSRIEDTCLKQEGLVSIIRYLTLVDVAQWNRAIGRTLDVGPSELHLYLAIQHLHNYCVDCDPHPNDSRNHERMLKFLKLSNTLSDIVTKMRKEHIDILLLVIAGVSSPLIEALKKAPAILLVSHTIRSVSQKVKDLFEINLDYSVRGEIFLFLQQSSEKPKSPEMAHCATLAPFFALFCRCIPSLPSDIMDRILCCSFGDSDAMHCCIRDALLRESIPTSSTTDLVSFAHIAHPTICNRMFRVNLSIPDECDDGQYAMGYYISLVADTIDGTKSSGAVSLTTGSGCGEVGSLFRYHISAMRSITSKGLCALELGEAGSWNRQQYMWQLLNLFVKLEVASMDDQLCSKGLSHMMGSTWGDVCWLDEDAISDYLSAVPHRLHTSCMHVYVGIATLFHLGSIMVDQDGDELVLAIKYTTTILLTRIYLAELVFLNVLSTSDFDRIHTEALSFGDDSWKSSNVSSPSYKPSDDIINLLKAVTDAVVSSHIVDETVVQRSILLLMQLQRAWTLLNDPILQNLLGSWKLPSNLLLLQCSLKARSQNELMMVYSAGSMPRPCVIIPLELMVAVLKLLLRSHMYSAFIELLVVDFALMVYSVKVEKRRVLSDEEGPVYTNANANTNTIADSCSCSCWDDWQQNQEVVKAVDLLPDHSSYKRQVSS